MNSGWIWGHLGYFLGRGGNVGGYYSRGIPQRIFWYSVGIFRVYKGFLRYSGGILGGFFLGGEGGF
jgi:hypothetical protein